MENNRWGRRIRAFRKLKAMKQLDFAKQIGMSTSILGQIERGTRVPTQQQLDTYGIRAEYRGRRVNG